MSCLKKHAKKITFALTLGLALGAASGVSAHEHELTNPGTSVTFKEEPFHGVEGFGSAVFEHNPHYVNTPGPNYLHPFHYMVHMGPSQSEKVSVVRK